MTFAASAARADDAPSRAVTVGGCFQYLLSNPFAGASSNAGPGVIGAYEFLVSPRTSVGIELGYRFFFGHQAIGQLVYGLDLKHYLAALEPHPQLLRPYFAYGLLQQITFQRSHSGAAITYDAGLMAGTDLPRFPLPLFVQAAVHVSHLTGLDQPPRNISYLELLTGVRISW